ncbi:nitrate/nitrite transporter [Nocardioides sp.]|uniref:MFS transporter n=1 Tax=Nocardioides sp. TaxID=35761 RepID=UPI002725CC92|nr:MFS transporter [Nocardioides sp.]MDO9457479.1 MFS transporter [Nocardioides sp.]
MTTPEAAPGGRLAYAIWGVGLATYLVAVFHRSSLAVAGLLATERFDISASQLATFTMMQLVVYALMQVPVGLLVDRYGPRTVMLTGTIVLTAAQAGFALAETYPAALVARLFVGMGDAMTFICVLRLVSRWFPVRRVPLVTQLTGTLGQLGSVLAAIPMTFALRELGWTGAYLTTASLGVVLTVALVVVVRDAPDQRRLVGPRLSLAAVRRSLAASWAHPGTRLGFWMHFTAQFSSTTLGLLWGYPFLVQGEGLSEGTAGLLLTLIVVAIMYAGPLLGYLVGRHPWHRSSMVLVIVWAIVAVWTAVLAWPGQAPLWLLVLLTQVVGLGGPASVIGFDLARTSNPAERLASATGIINQAGFAASLVLVVAVGLILDWRTPGASTDYTPEAFRWAMSAQYVLWAIGLVQIYRYRHRARRVIDRAALEAGAAVT